MSAVGQKLHDLVNYCDAFVTESLPKVLDKNKSQDEKGVIVAGALCYGVVFLYGASRVLSSFGTISIVLSVALVVLGHDCVEVSRNIAKNKQFLGLRGAVWPKDLFDNTWLFKHIFKVSAPATN